MKNLVEWLKRRTKKKASAEKSKEVADSQETTSGKSTATTSTGAEGSFVGDVSQRADLIAARIRGTVPKRKPTFDRFSRAFEFSHRFEN